MAVMSGNQLFPNGRNYFLDGTLDWDTDTWYVFLANHGEDQPDDTDNDAADITARYNSATEASNQIGSPVATDGDGIADGNDVTMTSVAAAGGDGSCESIVIAREVGVDQTSPADDELLYFADTATSGLPVTPNGGDISITWAATTNKIFKL